MKFSLALCLALGLVCTACTTQWTPSSPSDQSSSDRSSLNRGAKLTFTPSVTMQRNADGRLGIFYGGNDGQVYLLWQDAPGAPAFGRNSWTALTGGNYGNYASTRLSDGRIVLCGVGADKQLACLWQNKNSDAFASSWTPVPSSFDVSEISLQPYGSHGLAFCALLTSGAVYCQWRSNAETATSWGNLKPGALKHIAMNKTSDGRIAVCGPGLDNRPYCQWEDGANSCNFPSQGAPTCSFSRPWLLLADGQVYQVAMNRTGDGRLGVIGIGLDNQLWGQWQDGPGSAGFSRGWYEVAPGEVTNVTADSTSDGRFGICAIGSHTGLVWCAFQDPAPYGAFPAGLNPLPYIAANGDTSGCTPVRYYRSTLQAPVMLGNGTRDAIPVMTMNIADKGPAVARFTGTYHNLDANNIYSWSGDFAFGRERTLYSGEDICPGRVVTKGALGSGTVNYNDVTMNLGDVYVPVYGNGSKVQLAAGSTMEVWVADPTCAEDRIQMQYIPATRGGGFIWQPYMSAMTSISIARPQTPSGQLLALAYAEGSTTSSPPNPNNACDREIQTIATEITVNGSIVSQSILPMHASQGQAHLVLNNAAAVPFSQLPDGTTAVSLVAGSNMTVPVFTAANPWMTPAGSAGLAVISLSNP